MKIKNFKSTRKLAGLVLAGTISTLSLTGCGNHTEFDFKYTFNKAIIFDDNVATIIDIVKWCDYEGEQYQITTKSGLVILTSSRDTKLFDDRKSNISAEDFARIMKNDDVIINHYDEGINTIKSLTKTQ